MAKRSTKVDALRAPEGFQVQRAEVLTAETHYEVLGVKTTASQAELKQAFYRRAAFFHPDRAHSYCSDAHDLMSRVNKAYAVLGDPAGRKRYDMLERIVTEPCETCEGKGVVSKSIGKGFSTKKTRIECPSCGGSGRVSPTV